MNRLLILFVLLSISSFTFSQTKSIKFKILDQNKRAIDLIVVDNNGKFIKKSKKGKLKLSFNNLENYKLNFANSKEGEGYRARLYKFKENDKSQVSDPFIRFNELSSEWFIINKIKICFLRVRPRGLDDD